MEEMEKARMRKHKAELYNLADQCKLCKLRRPDTPTKDCNIHKKLVVDDSPVAWKHKHLFFVNRGGVYMCKMFQGK